MFYDYETGEAQFQSPDGVVQGEIVLKRQYRIREGEMEYMLESAMNIHDEVLQKELSAASDDKMKNIVATIQRDQNAIIRNEEAPVMIIQGVAGSGKTSIALHRIAFLLYRFKDTIQSKDMLIISPNKVFADYISNVLPELGEEDIPEVGIEELAKEWLEREFKIQTFFQQVSLLLEKKDPDFEQRIQAKASVEFLEQLQEYVNYAEQHYFKAKDIFINERLVPGWFLEERFQKFPKMPLFKRLEKLVGDVEHNVNIFYNYQIKTHERKELRNTIRQLFQFPNIRAMYKDFYQWIKKPQLFKMIKGGKLEYSDVFPMIFLKMRMEGIKPMEDVKHLLVDEMQDYTAVQYAVLKELFPCKKTILGDANQSVNPFSSSTAESIQSVFQDAQCMYLNKSYRSTYEITRFAQNISANKQLEAVERHGQEPQVIACESVEEELVKIKEAIQTFNASDYQSLGVICRTQDQAALMKEALRDEDYRTYLLSMESATFSHGVIICTAHMAKGLEFDQVIVPDVTAENYDSPMDRSMLYVACTRAMHRLTLTYIKNPSAFLS